MADRIVEHRVSCLVVDPVLVSTSGHSLGDSDVARALALRLRLSFRELHDFRVEPELFRLMPVDLMSRTYFAPVAQTAEAVDIVMADTTDSQVLDELEEQTGKAGRAAGKPPGRQRTGARHRDRDPGPAHGSSGRAARAGRSPAWSPRRRWR